MLTLCITLQIVTYVTQRRTKVNFNASIVTIFIGKEVHFRTKQCSYAYLKALVSK